MQAKRTTINDSKKEVVSIDMAKWYGEQIMEESRHEHAVNAAP